MTRFSRIIADIGANGSAPEWFLLFRAGWIEIEGEGQALVDEEAFRRVRAAFDRRGNDLVVDYEHASLGDGPAPASGWLVDLRWAPGRGIEARVNWTETASGYIARAEYRYFSPVFLVSRNDRRVSGLHSVALTNTPKTNHLHPIAAKLAALDPEESMNVLEQIKAKLGLPEAADDSAVLAAFDAVKAKADTKPAPVVAEEVIAALELEDGADTSAVVAGIHALKQAPKGMVPRTEFDALKAQIAKRDAAEMVAAAMQAGKITPDQKDWADGYAKDDPGGFRAFVAKAPVVVPVTPLPGKSADAADPDDETILAVAKMMGNTPEDLKKYGGMD